MVKSLREKYDVTEQEEKMYALPKEEDYKILSIVKRLEKKDLSSIDGETVALIKTQLLDDWRKPLLDKLNQLLQIFLGYSKF